MQRFLIRDFSEALKTKERYLRLQSVSLSREWKAASDENLESSVEYVNEKLKAAGKPPNIRFVKVNFGPDDSFNAPETSLWNLKTSEFSRHNFWGRLKYILAFRFISDLKPNDEQLESRANSCKVAFKDSKTLRVRCKFASLGHPNKAGAQKYATAIESALRPLFESISGWLQTAASRR